MLIRPGARKVNISVTLDPDLLGAVERLARKEGVTLSAILREILRAEMERKRMIGGRQRATAPGRVRGSISKTKNHRNNSEEESLHRQALTEG